MKRTPILSIGILILFMNSCKLDVAKNELIHEDSRIISFKVERTDEIQFFLNDDKGHQFFDFETVKRFLNSKEMELKFAFNGGMYKRDHSPHGLYIEKGEIITSLDTMIEGYGNFYLQPNGIFSVDKKGKGEVIQTSEFTFTEEINYATQSGPMLLIDGEIHPKFRKDSNNLNIRNGVGILPNGNVLFAISNTKVNLYVFANYFKQNACLNALYLDGFVSKLFYPPVYNQ